MKKPVAIYPPFAAAFPVLAIFSANLTLCPLSDLWRPLGITVAASAAIWFVLGLLFRDASRAAVAATVVIVACFTYSAFANWFYLATYVNPLLVWVPGIGLIAALAGFKWRWHKPLNVISVALVLSSIGSISFGYLRIARDEARLAHAAHLDSTGTGARPDIYYVILDGYGREDQLQRVMHYDDSAFIKALEQRGFFVASGSHSNYVQTELSLASSLNMNFIPDLMPKLPARSDDRAPLDQLASQNAVSEYLRSLGYEYIAITTGFPSLTFNTADLRLGAPHKISLLESTIASMTPLSLDGSIDQSEYAERRDILAAAFSNLKMVASTSGVKPKFVFVHVLAPHPPFVVNADGSAIPGKPKGPFGYWDGSDFFSFGNTPQQYMSGYVNQLQYVNSQTLLALDTILAKGGQPPVILLQGDHGSKLGLSQNSLAKTDINECMSNLMAYHVPDDVRAKLYSDITPVNSFRIVLSTLFGANLPNLADRNWFCTFDSPYQFTEITDKLSAWHNH